MRTKRHYSFRTGLDIVKLLKKTGQAISISQFQQLHAQGSYPAKLRYWFNKLAAKGLIRRHESIVREGGRDRLYLTWSYQRPESDFRHTSEQKTAAPTGRLFTSRSGIWPA